MPSDEYVSDKPVVEAEHDLFSRSQFAQRLARTIAVRRDDSSLVIGLYAPWGEGKTSALHLVEQALAEQLHVVTVWFNPWMPGSPADLIRGLFDTLAEALGRSLTNGRERVGQFLSTYGKVASAIGSLVAQGDLGNGVSEVGQAMSAVTLETLRERITEVLKAEGKRVVVFMDDIDRLDRAEIQTVLKLVKLTADFNYLTYVLAFDDEVVVASLQERYASGDQLAGRRFLEKIVQVPLRLPRIQPTALRRYTLQALEQALQDARVELTLEQITDFVYNFDVSLNVRITTPRIAKLYANALTFALPILAGEVDPVEQMLVEGLRVLYPALHEGIRRYPDLFLQPSQEGRARNNDEQIQLIKNRIDQLLQPYSMDEQEAARRLLITLFPRLNGVYGNTFYGGEWDQIWGQQQKVANNAYFERYFAYAIPMGDIADREITDLFKLARTGQQTELVQAVRSRIRTDNAGVAVKKLRQVEGSVDLAAALPLARALVASSSLLPHTQNFYGFGGPFTQGAVWVTEVVGRIEDGAERAQVAQELVDEAETLDFAQELISWFRVPRRKDREALGDQAPAKLLPETVAHLERLVAEKVRAKAEEGYLPDQMGSEAQRALYLWAKNTTRDETQAHLLSAFDEQPDRLFTFLDLYLGRAQSMVDGRPLRAAFEWHSYDNLIHVIDPEQIAQRLRTQFGSALGQPEAYRAGRSVTEDLAHQFMATHQAAQHHTSPETSDKG